VSKRKRLKDPVFIKGWSESIDVEDACRLFSAANTLKILKLIYETTKGGEC
jgi:hypothetical protein